MYSATFSRRFLFHPSNTNTNTFSRRHILFSSNSFRTPFLCFLRPLLPLRTTTRYHHHRHLSASLAHHTNLSLSWLSPPDDDEFRGWAFLEYPAQPKPTNKGFPSYVVVGIGTTLAVLVALLATLSLSRKGFKIQFRDPMHVLQGKWSTVKIQDDRNKTAEFESNSESSLTTEAAEEAVPASVTAPETATLEKLDRIIVPVSVDATQEEALLVLKTLKIIDDDVEACQLCTRREFARWLVKLNSYLERNPKHRIAPIISLSESVVTAFDDVGVEDPDFRSIQALAEAGVVPSKLYSNDNSGSGGSNSKDNINFCPDRFISRQDLIDWKAQLEYEFFSGVTDQISIKKAGYMDVKEITSPAVYMDMLAGDRSILRRVFGQSKRFQPNKPSSNAQVAVALTSGRMKEAISAELSRIEAENSVRRAEAEEIRFELLSRGDIQKFWDQKYSEEKNRGVDLERIYHDAVNTLEEEKSNQDKIYAEYLKEKAAMDCQKQLLLNLKKEVDEISERLASERVIYLDENQTVQKLLSDLKSKHEEILDTKSTLEAEKEALQILRSWVEDEARRSQARAAVLEEVGRRWKWDDQV
ncbi:hypothetical protein HN51_070049 [Arachis hypogaea]|uniref:SLH domain-containing protein n=1 Tax=Arachis hypogaea TaxID=3818 RepID=A0A444Z3W4_ARAHY|nr:uncharacterized protein LOC107643791 isoform X2 [Arachis ipaensis]XP_025655063.1 uncharacterized protein LOC112750518 isoform X2 [Arachis hypogaea]QHO12390.1 uncharacterized protein DS421_15g506530 [Arachis hypogaea]RYR08734.1 hypothetical protein Ahy_B05g076562 [Arachis hypogaea]